MKKSILSLRQLYPSLPPVVILRNKSYLHNIHADSNNNVFFQIHKYTPWNMFNSKYGGLKGLLPIQIQQHPVHQ